MAISKTFLARSAAMVGFMWTPPLYDWHDHDAANSDFGTTMPHSVAGGVHSITAPDATRSFAHRFWFTGCIVVGAGLGLRWFRVSPVSSGSLGVPVNGIR